MIKATFDDIIISIHFNPFMEKNSPWLMIIPFRLLRCMLRKVHNHCIKSCSKDILLKWNLTIWDAFSDNISSTINGFSGWKQFQIDNFMLFSLFCYIFWGKASSVDLNRMHNIVDFGLSLEKNQMVLTEKCHFWKYYIFCKIGSKK